MATDTNGKSATAQDGFRLRRQYEAQHRLPKPFRKHVKGLLSYLPKSHTLRLLAYWSDLRLWKKAHLNAQTPEFADRYALWNYLAEVHLPERVAYLEFGCAAGEAVRDWARRLPHPDARFWGFDTFTGMPEAWSGLGWKVAEGAWTQGGEMPPVDDPRIGYVKGRFQDSLEGFIEREDLFNLDVDHYIVHIDADLYSATLYVLVMMRPLLGRATFLFDEFDCVLDEMRALDDFCRAFGLEYDVLATASSCEKVAIRFTDV